MSKATLDAIDGKILQYLVRNARMPFLEIARECGISGAAIHQRIRKLHDSGVILGSRLIVDPKMLGFDVCALIGICVQDPMYMMQTMEKLKEIPEIVECHFITGNFNILVKLYCLDNEHLMKTIFDGILRIQGISTTQTFISLNEAFQRQVSIDFIRAAERGKEDRNRKRRDVPAGASRFLWLPGPASLRIPKIVTTLQRLWKMRKNRRSFVLPRSLHSRRLMRWRVTTAFAARFTATPTACS